MKKISYIVNQQNCVAFCEDEQTLESYIEQFPDCVVEDMLPEEIDIHNQRIQQCEKHMSSYRTTE